MGTLTDPTTLVAERALVRSPWETSYMFAVSILGALWLACRIAGHWTIDRTAL